MPTLPVATSKLFLWLARHPEGLPPAALAAITDAVATCPADPLTDARSLTRLREVLIGHPGVPAEVALSLSGDPDTWHAAVLAAYVGRPDVTGAPLTVAVTGADPKDRVTLAEAERTCPEALTVLGGDPTVQVRAAVLANAAAPTPARLMALRSLHADAWAGVDTDHGTVQVTGPDDDPQADLARQLTRRALSGASCTPLIEQAAQFLTHPDLLGALPAGRVLPSPLADRVATEVLLPALAAASNAPQRTDTMALVFDYEPKIRNLTEASRELLLPADDALPLPATTGPYGVSEGVRALLCDAWAKLPLDEAQMVNASFALAPAIDPFPQVRNALNLPAALAVVSAARDPRCAQQLHAELLGTIGEEKSAWATFMAVLGESSAPLGQILHATAGILAQPGAAADIPDATPAA